MIQITPHMKIMVAVQPTDFRRGIDGLARVCRDELKDDPFSGAIFVFVNRRRTSIKLLMYNSQGFWLATKRLSTGRFGWWPQGEERTLRLEAYQLHLLLWNGDPSTARVMPPWRSIAAAGE
jgi:transposase